MSMRLGRSIGDIATIALACSTLVFSGCFSDAGLGSEGEPDGGSVSVKLAIPVYSRAWPG